MGRKSSREKTSETSSSKLSDKAADAAQSNSTPAPKSRGLALKALVVVLAAAVAAAGIMWWQDRDLRLATTALEAKEPEKALALVDEYLSKRPDSELALALRARTLVALDESPEEVVRIFDQVGLANTDEMHAYAKAQIKLNQWSMALPYLLKVLEERPNDAMVLHETATCQHRLGLQTSAVETAMKATKCEGREAQGYVLLGTIFRDIELKPDAAKAFEDALLWDPEAAELQLTPSEFFRQYGRLLLDIGQPAKAGPQLARSAQLEPTADAFAGLGEAFVLLGKTAEAEAAWRQALELDPLSDDARVGLAAVALRSKEPRKALEWLKPLETQGRGRAKTAQVIAAAYEGIQDEAAAKIWKERAATHEARERFLDEVSRIMLEEPESSWAQALRAYQFAMMGNWEEADAMLGSLPKKAEGDLKAIVEAIVSAVENKQPLPPIEQAPIKLPPPKAPSEAPAKTE